MKNKDSQFRKFQRFTRDKVRLAKSTYEGSEFNHQVSEVLSNTARSITKTYRSSGLNEVVKPAIGLGADAIQYAKDKAIKVDKNHGISKTLKSAKNAIVVRTEEPARKYLAEYGVTELVINVGRKSGQAYGSTRSFIKPYFEPEDARELLENTRKELTYITACILQISYKEAEGWVGEFGKLLSAKIASVAGTVTLFGLISTFGTAGTGTAIASLSGAAATNATLASIGGVVGGGMAAGALVLSGIGIIIGIATYKLFSSTARNFDSLPDEDRQIVSTTGMLLAAIQEQLKLDKIELSAEDGTMFLEQSLIPLHEYLDEHADSICSRLDTKNAIAYRQHVLRDYPPVVIEGFRHYIKHAPVSIEALIGGVFYALLTNTALDGTPEEKFVLESLRRSKASLHDASERELAQYLDSLSPEQMRGVANNVKGIYHEILWVEEYNSTHDESYAVLHNSTVHQGSDVQVYCKETGDLLGEYQLKSTNNISYVNEHLDKYPNISVLATTEVANEIDSVNSSGFSNEDITAKTDSVFDAVADNTVLDRVTESAELVGLVSVGRATLAVLKGQGNISEAGARTLSSVVQAASATGITAYLFS